MRMPFGRKTTPIVMSKKLTQFFMWSHLTGWILANIQTIWIIIEIRRNTRIMRREHSEIKKEVRKKR